MSYKTYNKILTLYIILFEGKLTTPWNWFRPHLCVLFENVGHVRQIQLCGWFGQQVSPEYYVQWCRRHFYRRIQLPTLMSAFKTQKFFPLPRPLPSYREPLICLVLENSKADGVARMCSQICFTSLSWQL